jgi:hypothetical protein
MTQQVINVGTNPNDMTGDPLRTAYIKCNQNFTELYDNGYQKTTITTAAPGNSQIYSKPLPNSGVIFGDVRVVANTDTMAETIGLSILARTGSLNQVNFNATGVLSLGQGTIVGTGGYNAILTPITVGNITTNNLVITANTQVANVSFSIYSQLFGD